MQRRPVGRWGRGERPPLSNRAQARVRETMVQSDVTRPLDAVILVGAWSGPNGRIGPIQSARCCSSGRWPILSLLRALDFGAR